MFNYVYFQLKTCKKNSSQVYQIGNPQRERRFNFVISEVVSTSWELVEHALIYSLPNQLICIRNLTTKKVFDLESK